MHFSEVSSDNLENVYFNKIYIQFTIWLPTYWHTWKNWKKWKCKCTNRIGLSMVHVNLTYVLIYSVQIRNSMCKGVM